jgi:hypothetical protein
VYDYVDGKADWMAYGLPVEGADGPFLGDELQEATSCDVGATVGDVRGALGDSPVVVLADGLAVGEVEADTLAGHADSEKVLDIMDPVPTTVRPSVTVAAAAGDAFDRELASVMEAVEERFGDREPSEDELRTFLRERLVAEGRSPEDADRFLDELEGDH